MKYSRKSVIYLIFFSLFFSGYAYGDRNHSDIEDIGNRDINGLVALIFPNFVSLEKEIQIGAQYAQYFEQSARLVEDPVVTGYIDRLGQKIVKNSDAKVPFVIKVVDTDEVNAFALPGGYFYINKGLILEARTESELAGVMAHEIAHVTARHATERLTKSQLLQFASLPALFIGGSYLAQMAIYNGLGLGMSLAVLGITRKGEEEADQLGTQYLWNSGYDPYGYLTFFNKMQEKEKEKPGKFAGFFRTHPPVEDRQLKVENEISFLPIEEETIVTTSEFQKVKQRLVSIDNKLLASVSGDDGGGTKRPSLKRKTNTDRSERDEPETKTSRPTLKRP